MESNETDPIEQDSVGPLKAAIAVFGSVAFFAASTAMAWASFRHQMSGERLPNGTGGTMSFGTGYWIAIALFLVSAVWLLAARKLLRHK